MPTVNSCCCGCTLRTGTLIILWLGVVGSVINIISGMASSAHQYALAKILISAILLGIYIMGIKGVQKERASYLKPVLGYQILCMVLFIILMIILPIIGPELLSYLSSAFEYKKNASPDQVAASIVGGEIGFLVVLCLTYYFFIVVSSFCKELKGEIPPQSSGLSSVLY